jgi:hypothetical protein
VDVTECAGQRRIAKTGEQPLALPRHGCWLETECLDEQRLHKVLENQITARTVCVCFLTNQLDDSTYACCSFHVAPNVNYRRQESHEQLCIRTIEAEIPPEQAHCHRARLGTVTSFTRMIEWDECWLDVEIAREREARHLREENKIALLELERANPVSVEETRSVENEAEGWMLITRLPNAPLSCSADHLGEDGLRAQKR